MKVILLSDLTRAGKRGQEVEVKPGYARNYLIPHGMAVESTDGNRKWFEHQRKKIDARADKEREEAAAVAAELSGVRVEIPKRVGETETLYGSVTATDVAEALEAQGVVVDRRKLDLGGGIKTLGEHPVIVALHPEVTAEVTVIVVREG